MCVCVLILKVLSWAEHEYMDIPPLINLLTPALTKFYIAVICVMVVSEQSAKVEYNRERVLGNR